MQSDSINLIRTKKQQLKSFKKEPDQKIYM